MTLNTTSYGGRLDYEQLLRIKQMDAGKAELYKAECRQNFQKKRVSDAVKNLKDEYMEQIEDDPERKSIYADRFRNDFLQIPGIEESEEFKDIYIQMKDQSGKLEVLDEQMRAMTATHNNNFDQEGMEDLSADEPDVRVSTEEETVAEVETAQAVDDRVNEAMDDLGTDEAEEAPSTEQTIEDLRAIYTAKTGKNVAPAFKNNRERLEKKIAE